MEVIPKMVDLAIQPTEIENVKVLSPATAQAEPYYPYGLCICLDAQTLEKLAIEDVMNVGDMIHFHAMGKVTSVSDNQQSGKRVEIQITAMAAEDEDAENEEEEQAEMKTAYKAKNPYKK